MAPAGHFADSQCRHSAHEFRAATVDEICSRHLHRINNLQFHELPLKMSEPGEIILMYGRMGQVFKVTLQVRGYPAKQQRLALT